MPTKIWLVIALLWVSLLPTTNVMAETSVHSPNTLKIIWSTDVDGRKPADTLSFSAPVVTGTGEQARIVLGGADARVHIYDMQGKELYRLPIEQNADSGATTLSSGLVVLGDSQAKLYGIDAQQGQVMWKLSLSSSVTSMPLAVDDDVVVQTTDNNIYRINAQGEKVWSFASQQGGLGLYITSSPMLHDGNIYALLSNGDAIAMNAQTGDLLWRKQLLLDTDAVMLSKLKKPQATPLWLSSISFDGRVLQDVVLFSFYQGKIFLLNRQDGSTVLSQDLSLKSSPILLHDTLYSVDTQGVLQAMNRNTGQQQWKKTLSVENWMGPIVWHDALWVLSMHGELFKVSLQGDVLASLDIGGSTERSPVMTQYGLLIHNTLGGLYLVHE